MLSGTERASLWLNWVTSASRYGPTRVRLLQYRPVSDWRQIQARIRKARTSADPPGQLTALYDRTHDAMVAFELAQLHEKAGTTSEAIRWFTTAAERFRRPQWKIKAEEGLVRLGAPVPVAPAAIAGVAVSETTAEPVAGSEPIIAEFSEEQARTTAAGVAGAAAGVDATRECARLPPLPQRRQRRPLHRRCSTRSVNRSHFRPLVLRHPRKLPSLECVSMNLRAVSRPPPQSPH